MAEVGQIAAASCADAGSKAIARAATAMLLSSTCVRGEVYLALVCAATICYTCRVNRGQVLPLYSGHDACRRY